MKCLFSARAEYDLEEIADYIAQDNPRRALSYLREIRARCGDILDFPEAAPLRPEFGEGIRMVPMGRYLIFYTVHPNHVRIERILAGSRNISEDYF